MARAMIQHVAMRSTVSGTSIIRPATAVTITKEDGSAIDYDVFAALSGGSPLTPPFVTDANGKIELYSAAPHGALIQVSGDAAATRSGFYPHAEDIATRTGVEEFTNKTLTTPIIGSPMRMTQVVAPGAPVTGTYVYPRSTGHLYYHAAGGSEQQIANLGTATQTFTGPVNLSPTGGFGGAKVFADGSVAFLQASFGATQGVSIFKKSATGFDPYNLLYLEYDDISTASDSTPMYVKGVQGDPNTFVVGQRATGWSVIRGGVFATVRYPTQGAIDAGGVLNADLTIRGIANGTRTLEIGQCSAVGIVPPTLSYIDTNVPIYAGVQAYGQLANGQAGVEGVSQIVLHGTDNARYGLVWVGHSNTPRGVDETCVITITGNPTGGSWVANYNGGTSSAIDWDADATEVTTALEAMATIDAGEVAVSVTGGGGVVTTQINVRFTFTKAGQSLPSTITVGSNSLTGGSSPTVTPVTTKGSSYGYASTYYSYADGGTRVSINGDRTRPYIAIKAPGWIGGLCDPTGPIDMIAPNASELTGGGASTAWSWDGVNPAVPALSFMFRARWDQNVTTPSHLTLAGQTDATTRMVMGPNTTSGYGSLQFLNAGVASVLALNPSGGNVVIGATSGTTLLTVKQSADNANGGWKTIVAGGGTAFAAGYASASDNNTFYLQTSAGSSIRVGGSTAAIALNIAGVAALATNLIDASVGGAARFSVSQNGGLTFVGNEVHSGIVATAPGASQNNYNPAGLATARVLRVNPSAGINITGIVAQASGFRLLLMNAANAFDITLTHEDAASTAANEFNLPNNANLVIRRGGAVELIYDTTVSRWKTVAI